MKPKTVLRHSVGRTEHDEDILRAVRAVGRDARTGGPLQTIGFRNGAGMVYRVVMLFGDAQRRQFDQLMEEIGLVPEDAQVTSSDGCDVVFRRAGPSSLAA